MGRELRSYPCLKCNRRLLPCRMLPGLSFICPKWHTKKTCPVIRRWPKTGWEALSWSSFCFSLRIGFRLEPAEEAGGVRWLIKEPGSGDGDVFSQQTSGNDKFSAEALIDEIGPVAWVAPSKCAWKVVCRPLFRLSSFPQRLFEDLTCSRHCIRSKGYKINKPRCLFSRIFQSTNQS